MTGIPQSQFLRVELKFEVRTQNREIGLSNTISKVILTKSSPTLFDLNFHV